MPMNKSPAIRWSEARTANVFWLKILNEDRIDDQTLHFLRRRPGRQASERLMHYCA
jgi:hypothetical protein